jgi:hypothetical protein
MVFQSNFMLWEIIMHHDQALAKAKAGTGAPVNFTGTWINELGSQVAFVQTGNALAGIYQSAVSTGGTSTTGNVLGYVDGDLIGFAVHWISFQAITVWAGQLQPNTGIDTIKTLWQMTNQVDPGDEWASINAGSDIFTRK